ncbi:MAG: hypothetical protein BGO30_00050 [Bacteroidetes bacterium 41-46]|jgi:hypothetical protein|nr:MAG: hypothetical protein BGO30_00050 [Bacteroidetes bacterium 41-46]
MRRFWLIALVTLTALSTGCNRYSEIEIVSVKLTDIKIHSTSRAEVEVEYIVKNGSKRDLTLSGADGFLTKERVNFAQFTLMESEMIERGATTASKARFKVELLDPLSLFSMGLNINSWKMSDFEIDARGTISNDRGSKRTFKFKNLPLEKMLKRF